MPVVAVDQFVPAAINSILAQRDVQLELLLTGPPRGTERLHNLYQFVEQHYQHDTRIRIIARAQSGIVSALNCALVAATGNYIARMDADDIACEHRLRQQLACALAQPQACLVGACVEIFSDSIDILQGNRRYQRWLNTHCSQAALRHACFIESPLPHPTWFAHRSVWDSLGPYCSGDFPEDYDMVLRAWLQGIAMVKPPEVLLRWREHENRLTRTDIRYRRSAFTLLKARAIVDARSGLQVHEGRPVWIAGTGRNARSWHDALVQQGAQVLGFLDIEHPKVRLSLKGKPVISYPEYVKRRTNALLVTAVTNDTARNSLAEWFSEHDMLVGRDVIVGG